MGGTSTASGKGTAQHAGPLAGSLVLTAFAVTAPSRETRCWRFAVDWVLGTFATPTVGLLTARHRVSSPESALRVSLLDTALEAAEVACRPALPT